MPKVFLDRMALFAASDPNGGFWIAIVVRSKYLRLSIRSPFRRRNGQRFNRWIAVENHAGQVQSADARNLVQAECDRGESHCPPEWCTDNTESTVLSASQVALDEVTIIATDGVGRGARPTNERREPRYLCGLVASSSSMIATVLPRDLQAGDIVTPTWTEERASPFDAALVECVNDDAITLFRPYATSHGFVYGQHPSVIALVGSERYQIHRDSTAHTFKRWHTTLAG